MQQAPRVRRVAIADDSAAFLSAAASYVTTLPGFQLAGVARTAPQTIDLVEKSMPDVLILDLRLAPKRGELLRRVKSTPAAPAVVAVTLFDTPEAAAAAKLAGADELVGKVSFFSGLARALARLFPSAA
jgi:DNA-binding NarL/FixJ family response regulator